MNAFKNLTLAKKLTLGFGLILSLLVVVGAIAYIALQSAASGFTEYRTLARYSNLAGQVQSDMLMVQMNAKDYMISGQQKNQEELSHYLKEAEEVISTVLREVTEPRLLADFEKIGKDLKAYEDAFSQVVALKNKRDQLVGDILEVKGLEIEKTLTEILMSAKDDGDLLTASGASLATRNLLLARLYVVKFLVSNEAEAVARVKKEFEALDEELAVFDGQIRDPKRRELLDVVLSAVEQYKEGFGATVESINLQNSIIAETMGQLGPEIARLIEDSKHDIVAEQERIGLELQGTVKTSELEILILSIVAIAFGVICTLLIVRGILRQMGGDPSFVIDIASRVAGGDLKIDLPSNGEDEKSLYAGVRRMVSSMKDRADIAQQIASGNLDLSVPVASEKDVLGLALNEMVVNLNDTLAQIQVASEQISAGSGEVADSSQSLSQGATESASSLEEISASLNQLATQTTTNAENAGLANNLATEASDAALQGNVQMEAMVGAMAEIDEASQNISKIIKTIDEIAFQTNLLALNAAVEAARAGQHGKGFAVVAEEVRNLAARSAKAAQETSELIEGSVVKVAHGSSIANQTAEALTHIVGGIGKVNDLVSEIAVASSEQAQGVNQINQGLTQIDTVTQQNTANAEESAAAAEELSGQSVQLNEMLRRFNLQRQGGAEFIKTVPELVQIPSADGWGAVK